MRTLVIWLLAIAGAVPVMAAVTIYGDASDGDLVIDDERMINPATLLVSNALREAVRLEVRDASIFEVNDEVMIHTIEDLEGRAGAFEFHSIESIVLPDVIILDSPLIFDRPVDFGGTTQVVRVPNYQRLTIAAGGRLVASDYAPPLRSTGGVIAFRVRTLLTIEEGGMIDASECGIPGDLSGGAIAGQDGRQGRSNLGLGNRGTEPNGGGGGGGSSNGVSGGGGGGAGYGWAGALGTPYGEGGLGGEIIVSANLLKLPLGNAGGNGGGGSAGTSGAGGDGGGVIYIATSRTEASGEIRADGGAGHPASEHSGAGGGGGGSGGGIQILSRGFHLTQTGVISASGGVGSEGDGPGGEGGRGSNGRVRIAQLGTNTIEGNVPQGTSLQRPFTTDFQFRSD